MPEIRLEIPESLNLSDEQISALRDKLRSTLVETGAAGAEELAAAAKSQEQAEAHEQAEVVHVKSKSKSQGKIT